MFVYKLVFIFLFSLYNYVHSQTDYFCRNLVPQPSILIDQLMGIWYGIEIISHDNERHYVRHTPSCPIIHISEDRSYNTLYKDYNNYNYNYGSRSYDSYDATTEYGRTYPSYGQEGFEQGVYRDNQRDPYRRTPPYGRDRDPYNREQYNRDPYMQLQLNKERYNRERFGNRGNINPFTQHHIPNYDIHRQYRPDRYPPVGYGRKFYDEVKHLRLLWDENGVSTEYGIRLNNSMPGFWISSGPENGSSLDPQVGHFAGTIQVLKVVGNHLVLNFCHLQPDKRYFTVILSRSPTLNHYDISGVHGLLHRKGLDTNNIKKVCNFGAKLIMSPFLLILVLASIVPR